MKKLCLIKIAEEHMNRELSVMERGKGAGLFRANGLPNNSEEKSNKLQLLFRKKNTHFFFD